MIKKKETRIIDNNGVCCYRLILSFYVSINNILIFGKYRWRFFTSQNKKQSTQKKNKEKKKQKKREVLT